MLIDSDVLFDRNSAAAYAESWAFTFYLSETMPAKYNAYLKCTAARPDFVPASTIDRMNDFKAVFGADFTMLEARFLRYIAAIK